MGQRRPGSFPPWDLRVFARASSSTGKLFSPHLAPPRCHSGSQLRCHCLLMLRHKRGFNCFKGSPVTAACLPADAVRYWPSKVSRTPSMETAGSVYNQTSHMESKKYPVLLPLKLKGFSVHLGLSTPGWEVWQVRVQLPSTSSQSPPEGPAVTHWLLECHHIPQRQAQPPEGTPWKLGHHSQ